MTPLLSNQDWRRLRAWYTKHGRRFPWRHNATPWSILVGETLLHRTNANVVKTLYPLVRKTFPSPESITANKDRWISLLRKGGLFWRSRIFITTCEILLRDYGGHVPAERRELESLPGVGHYTASAVRCFGFGHRELITDTNTIRLAGRIAGKRVNPAHHRATRIQALTARFTKNGRPPLARDNYALLDLAAVLCRPRKPLCRQCPLRPSCHTARIQEGRRQLQR
jgi:A/G-specific adenine glycosylase